ncbi:MAG: hypothetical protein LQ339_008485 [Xanthoria mediterranea]|nr:MAG: hypothetical protein LQ339_008485 [Xanthoria mediterranea]
MFYSAFLLAPVALFLSFALYLLYGLLVNYTAARKTGLPLIVLPFDCGNPLWLIIDRKVAQLVRRIPFGPGTFTRFNWRGWEIWDRYRAHQQLGDAIFFVTPGKNYLQLCDAEAVSEIFQRRGDFPRPPESTEMLNIFGPNVGTVGGLSTFEDKLTDSTDGRTPMAKTSQDHSFIFQRAASKDDSSSYGEALKIILDRCIPLVVLGRKNLNNPWLPRKLRELYQATLVFQQHMTEAYESEKQVMMRNDKLENNLMTSLVRASLANVDQKGTTPGGHYEGLTEEEVYGNVFVFNFAGHDATANSLAIGICLLATRLDIQDWISEEINAILDGVDSTKSSYEATFRRLPRCLAVVFETVRLYTAVAIAKSTGSSARSLKLGADTVMVPKNTVVIPNYSALHTHPRYWGDNSVEFEPSRWITSSGPPVYATKGPSAHPVEHLKEPPARNSPFVGWSGGARSCPGRKFAQVEFVGVLVGLFRDFKVKPVPLKGEDDGMARARLLEQIKMDTGMRLLLQMLHPEKAVLEWRRR